jgi:transcriptional regulator with XRE-family HTH domain
MLNISIMEPKKIKMLLIDAEVTQTKIARNLGVTVSFINQIITGLRPTRRVREAIAQAVGKPVEELWPAGPTGKQINHNKVTQKSQAN